MWYARSIHAMSYRLSYPVKYDYLKEHGNTIYGKDKRVPTKKTKSRLSQSMLMIMIMIIIIYELQTVGLIRKYTQKKKKVEKKTAVADQKIFDTRSDENRRDDDIIIFYGEFLVSRCNLMEP